MSAGSGSSWFRRLVGLCAVSGLAIGSVASSQERLLRSTLQRQFGTAVPEEEDGEDRREDLLARAAYEVLIRAPEGEGRIPQERYLQALEHMRRMPLHSVAAGGAVASRVGDRNKSLNLPTWSPLGPGNQGGRTRSLVIDPSAPNTMYAGGVGGGVFKSTDGGANWVPLTDLISHIAIAALAIAPTVPSTLYAGTGEYGYGPEGLGIFKSTNSGATWNPLPSTQTFDFKYVNDIVVSPSNPARVYAATWTGVFRSLDGGTVWSRVVNTTECTDLAIRTDTGATDTVFSACGLFSAGSVRRNTDAGGAGAWTEVFSDGSNPSFGRARIGIAPGAQSTIYLMVAAAGSGALYGIFRSTASGDSGTWTAQRRFSDTTNDLNRTHLSNGLLTSECGFGVDNPYHQGTYDMALAVDPTNANIVYTGGILHMRSDDGGITWGMIDQSNDVHVDVHALVFHPTDNSVLFSANDGGLYKSTNPRGLRGGVTGQVLDYNACTTFPPAGSVAWASLNQGYETFQFYHGTVYAGGLSYFGGTQDNGTNKGTDGGGRNGWSLLFGGDGGVTGIDAANENNMYGERQNFDFVRSTNAGATWASARNGFTDGGFLFIAPFSVDPANGQRVWAGGNAIWRTFDGASNWVQASVALPGGGRVSAVTVSPFGAGEAVLVGSTAGDIVRNPSALSATSGTTWTAASPRPRSGVVSSVVVDPTNANIVYATYSTFGGTKLWKSTNGGGAFSALSGTPPFDLPDIPLFTVAIDPDTPTHLFVGTDLGVFSSFDGGLTWGVENTGFANVSTRFLTVKGLSLYAFTHGRGAWRVNKSASLPTVSIGDASVSEGDAGTTNATFSVSLSAPSSASLSVNYASADGTAQGGAQASQTNANPITIPTSGNGNPYPSSLTLAGATGTITKATVSLTSLTHNFARDVDVLLVGPAGQKVILMSDAGGVVPASNVNLVFDSAAASALSSPLVSGAFRPTNVNDGEGGDVWGAPAPVGPYSSSLADLNGTSPNGVWSLYVVDDAAPDGGSVASGWSLNLTTTGGDYTPVSGTLTFLPGETTRSVVVQVNGDTTEEPSETFTVGLSGASPGLLISDGTGQGTIVDDDAVLPSLSINDVAILEGNGGAANALLSVTLSAISAQTVTVSAQTEDGTATALSDYTAAGPTVVTFAPGEVSKTFAVSVLGDTAVEGNETFNVNLSSATNATISDATGLGTITNDDLAARTFVSEAGSDSNSCSVQTTPCRNISGAIPQTSTDGEIIILSPGEYETAPLTISKGLKVTSPSGTVAFIRQPVTIDALGQRVVLRGLTIKGGGSGIGLRLTAAQALSVEDTTIDGWLTGFILDDSAGALVSLVSSDFKNSGWNGVHDFGTGPGVNRLSISNCRFEGNVVGLKIQGGTSFVSDSSFVNNTLHGVSALGGTAVIRRSEFWLNGTAVESSAAVVRLFRSHVFSNTVGLVKVPGAVFESGGTNVVRGNGTNVSGSIGSVLER